MRHKSLSDNEFVQRDIYTMDPICKSACLLTLLASLLAFAPAELSAQDKSPGDSIAELTKGYEKVQTLDVSGDEMYSLYVDRDTGKVLAHLPSSYQRGDVFLLPTVVGGTETAGFGARGFLGRWNRVADRVQFIRPRLDVRSTGDAASDRSKEVIYTDSVLFEVPVIGEDAQKNPLVDLTALFLGRAERFFVFHPGGLDTSRATVIRTKLFAKNFTVTLRMPIRPTGAATDGRLITVAYSMRLMPENSSYKPRDADPRVGYFVTSFRDLSRIADPDDQQRYVMRWDIEKADSSLTLSPPKEPIVFYIDHKTPLRYRRWVREGVLEWNKAFEAVGIDRAIEVYQQDADSGAHMEKDPEDTQYNFVIWNATSRGLSMAMNRYNPRTGEILDADIVMNDGWIRAASDGYRRHLAEAFTKSVHLETQSWLDNHPQWNPSVLLAHPSEQRVRVAATPSVWPRPLEAASDHFQGEDVGHNATCSHADCRAVDIALARFLGPSVAGANEDGADIDEFVGAMVKDVVMHEFGHVLGLRHNLKASSVYSLDQITSEEWQAEGKPISGSVMDYNAVNYTADVDSGLSSHFMTALGPYDYWAIRFGYCSDDEVAQTLAESTNPLHAYLTDEDLYGPDPDTEMYDLGDPLGFVEHELALIQNARDLLLTRAAKKGESYQKVRDAYMALLVRHATAISVAARQVGGIHVYRDRIGDAERNPTEPVAAERQRRALDQILRYSFRDESFGLSPQLLAKMSHDKWIDDTFVTPGLPDPQLDAHDTVSGIQASALTSLINPTSLRRIYDCEMRIPQGEDAFTVAELLDKIQSEVWSELRSAPKDTHSVRNPFVTSLRRNLQSVHSQRMIDLAEGGAFDGAVASPVRSLALSALQDLRDLLDAFLKEHAPNLDRYTYSHFAEAKHRIDRALQTTTMSEPIAMDK